ncbi:type IV pilus modification protein PilV [Amphritea sp. 2_MG-2023]|uniref:type IV pilus modification protein PilV n=1 Tax=Amphritea TaxID=515417 RepID=UPI001C064E25|nr:MULTISPECIES: type IV pilus modification protein PilV [Amphritea]MBU2963980.1 type IV pilus modification protein PilV [Amphritea atlantica]MDO6420316.1 type IV pilus modification protein PilV [Amphritea sp. 2_MG-2023]MDX2421286.1 type IV pilus modification protein PilV [Amphritea sp.]
MPLMIKKYSSGVSLIEVLVSLVLVSIVLLGIAALSISGLSENQSAYYRSQANLIAYDIAARIRLNASYALDDDDNYAVDTSSSANLPSAVNCISSVSGCNDADQAAQDIREWTEHFRDIAGIGVDGASYQSLIPAAVGVVTANNGLYQVTISWQENDWNVSGENTRGVESHQMELNFRVTE